jgi:hypothetical protein
MTATLSDFRLSEGVAVSATGSVEVGSQDRTLLWVAPAWHREGELKLSGGDVPIRLRDSESLREWSGRKAVVEGIWHQGSIAEARLAPVGSVPPPQIFRASESLPTAGSLDPDEKEAILAELDTHAEGLILAVGGSSTAMSVQLLYVTSEFVGWHSAFKVVRLDVITSVSLA